MRSETSGRVCIVGPGPRFLSGITYYTVRLANALSERRAVSAILLRRLLPRALYPGRHRVGKPLMSSTELDERIARYDGLDWYWFPSIFRAAWFLLRRRPAILLLEWWTGTALHTFLALALLTRALGGRVVIEMHETLDTGELRLRWARRYVELGAPVLFRLADCFVVHSEFDSAEVGDHYGVARERIAVIPHPSYDVHQGGSRIRVAPEGVCNVLFFGVIRPFKGLEDLLEAFASMTADQAAGYWLTVVGETWEGWDLPARLIKSSPHRERITFVNRYVTDAEVDGYFQGADVVALPYHRSSQSGPLHVAMHYGLPVVITAVGGLVEAAERYEGSILVPPHAPSAIVTALASAAAWRGRRALDPHDWSATAARYDSLFDEVLVRAGAGPA